MTQLIKLSEKFVHNENYIFTLFLDDGFEITNVAEKYWDFVFLLLKGKILCVVLKVFLDKFWD